MLVTFEGVEGSGKSTQMEMAAAHFRARLSRVAATREPGGTPFGAELRRLLLSPEYAPDALTELFLYLADRRMHLTAVIRPRLAEGFLVLVDRFIDSTWVYQGYARGGEMRGLVERLNGVVTAGLVPGLTLLFDCPPEIGLERARQRHRRMGTAGREDRFEQQELAFHEAVRQGFRLLAAREPDRFVVLDARLSVDALHRQVCREIGERYGIS
ncbi:MAG: dTMP kinase [Deltaproteobacteria bacterium]|nr:dTMP kinase [Candidatus Anaeroferrophillacea bacterium]